jgi:hypothetical protein
VRLNPSFHRACRGKLRQPGEFKRLAHNMHLWKFAASVILLGAATASAARDDFLISCAGSPPDAVLQLPAPLANWGRVYCTKYGHTLAAKDRWIWSFPGAYAPVHLPAQMVREHPRELRHAAYFKRIELVQLGNREAERAADRLNEKLGTRADSPVSSAYRLVLTNQDGGKHTILFVLTTREVEIGKGHWGIWCDEECKDGSPFMLLNYEGQQK